MSDQNLAVLMKTDFKLRKYAQYNFQHPRVAQILSLYPQNSIVSAKELSLDEDIATCADKDIYRVAFRVVSKGDLERFFQILTSGNHKLAAQMIKALLTSTRPDAFDIFMFVFPSIPYSVTQTSDYNCYGYCFGMSAAFFLPLLQSEELIQQVLSSRIDFRIYTTVLGDLLLKDETFALILQNRESAARLININYKREETKYSIEQMRRLLQILQPESISEFLADEIKHLISESKNYPSEDYQSLTQARTYMILMRETDPKGFDGMSIIYYNTYEDDPFFAECLPFADEEHSILLKKLFYLIEANKSEFPFHCSN